MVFTTAYIMVGKYFSKNKGKAMGFALLGCGLGNIAFAHITNITLNTYGYWGAMLILGAIQLNNAISGALYRPLEEVKQLYILMCQHFTSSYKCDIHKYSLYNMLPFAIVSFKESWIRFYIFLLGGGVSMLIYIILIYANKNVLF